MSHLITLYDSEIQCQLIIFHLICRCGDKILIHIKFKNIHTLNFILFSRHEKNYTSGSNNTFKSKVDLLRGNYVFFKVSFTCQLEKCICHIKCSWYIDIVRTVNNNYAKLSHRNKAKEKERTEVTREEMGLKLL